MQSSPDEFDVVKTRTQPVVELLERKTDELAVSWKGYVYVGFVQSRAHKKP